MAASPAGTQPLSVRGAGLWGYTVREGRAGARNETCWGYHATNGLVTHIMN